MKTQHEFSHSKYVVFWLNIC